MAVTSKRRIVIYFTGDFEGQSLAEAENENSPAQVELITLAAGANTITKPSGALGVTIIPPSDNTVNITLKGVSGDTGIQLHDTHPTSLGLDASVVDIVLTAVAEIAGVRLIWS